MVVYTTDEEDPRFVAGEDMNYDSSSSSLSSEEGEENEAADVADEVHIAATDHEHENSHMHIA